MFSFQFEMKYLKRLSDPLNEITALDAYDCVKSVLRNLHAPYIVKRLFIEQRLLLEHSLPPKVLSE